MAEIRPFSAAANAISPIARTLFVIISFFSRVCVNWLIALYAIIILIKLLITAPRTSIADAFPLITSLKVENAFLIELITVYVAIAAEANWVIATDAWKILLGSSTIPCVFILESFNCLILIPNSSNMFSNSFNPSGLSLNITANLFLISSKSLLTSAAAEFIWVFILFDNLSNSFANSSAPIVPLSNFCFNSSSLLIVSWIPGTLLNALELFLTTFFNDETYKSTFFLNIFISLEPDLICVAFNFHLAAICGSSSPVSEISLQDIICSFNCSVVEFIAFLNLSELSNNVGSKPTDLNSCFKICILANNSVSSEDNFASWFCNAVTTLGLLLGSSAAYLTISCWFLLFVSSCRRLFLDNDSCFKVLSFSIFSISASKAFNSSYIACTFAIRASYSCCCASVIERFATIYLFCISITVAIPSASNLNPDE